MGLMILSVWLSVADSSGDASLGELEDDFVLYLISQTDPLSEALESWEYMVALMIRSVWLSVGGSLSLPGVLWAAVRSCVGQQWLGPLTH